MKNKEDNFKEKFKLALTSTAKVISDDYTLDVDKKNKNLSSKNIDFFELDNLNTKSDFIKVRAEADSKALIKKFSNKEIYKKNCPKNRSSKALYDLTEKVRCEILGTKILKGIAKNLRENYVQKLSLKRKDQLKTKEDVDIVEAFELYMLKNFFNIKLNDLSQKILSFWEKELDSSINNHIEFLTNNLENQSKYNSKFSKILEEMDIFDADEKDEKNDDEKNDDENNNNSKNDEDNQAQGEQEKNKQEESQSGIDGDYDLSEYKMEEQLVDTDSEKQSSENVTQRTNNNINNIEYAKIHKGRFWGYIEYIGVILW